MDSSHPRKMLLVNMHTAGLESAAGPMVRPGETAIFDTANPSTAKYMKAGLLAPEGAVLAARASKFAEAPTIAEVAQVKADNASKDATIKQLLTANGTHAATMRQVESRFQQLAESHAADMDRVREDAMAAAKVEAGDVIAALNREISNRGTALAEVRGALEKTKAELAEAKSDIARLTAPPGTPAATKVGVGDQGKPGDAPKPRATREG